VSHAARHPIVPRGNRCGECGGLIAWVDTECGSRNRPHWRHKPEGYHWGDRTARLRLAAQTVVTAWSIEADDLLGTPATRRAIAALSQALQETR